MQPIKWQGNLDDDCSARLGRYVAHCECLGDHRWFVSVGYNGVVPRPDDIFNSSRHGGSITSGDMARAVAETIMRLAHDADAGERK